VNVSSVTDPLLAHGQQQQSHQQSTSSTANSEKNLSRQPSARSRAKSTVSQRSNRSRKSHTTARSVSKSQVDPNDEQRAPFQMTYEEVERAREEQKHSTVISLNRDFFPIQNLLILVWIVYLVTYAADPLLNFSCFFGSKLKFQTIFTAMKEVYGLQNELVVDILIYIDSGIQAIIAIGLLLLLCSKLFRWIGFMSGKGYFLKDFFLRAWVEVGLICTLMVYFSVMTFLSNLLVGNRQWMFEMAQYFHSVVFAIMFFFPLGHPIIYYYVPVHWCLYFFSLAIDAIPYLGMNNEADQFSSYMSALCFQEGFGVGAFYTLKAFYLIFSGFFLIASLLLLTTILVGRSWYRSIVRENILLVYKLTIVFHMILIVFDSLYGERNNVWMDQGTIVMLLISALMYFHEPEICETWLYEKDRSRKNLVVDFSALFSREKGESKSEGATQTEYDDTDSEDLSIHEEQHELVERPVSQYVPSIDEPSRISVKEGDSMALISDASGIPHGVSDQKSEQEEEENLDSDDEN